jgi:hypothetical protein
MPTWSAQLESANIGESTLAYWKYGKQTTLTVTFDDSTEGQAKYVIPKMKALGITGTFFVNPGTNKFATRRATWDAAYSTYGQEIANHTWIHAGGSTETTAENAIDLASEYIKEHIYGLSPTSNKILAFNKSGGSGWHLSTTSEEWNMFIRGNYLFERKSSHGFSPGTTFEQMKNIVLTAFDGGNQATTGGSIHFHGVCDEEVYPGCSNESVEFPTNNGAVQKGQIYNFLEWLVDPVEFPAQNIWLAGYAEYRKYMVTRSGTTVSLESSSGSGDDTVFNVRLSYNMPASSAIQPVQYTVTYGQNWGNSNEMGDPDLYTCEPITVFTKVPSNWTAAKVTQETGESHVYRVHNGEVRYEAFTDSVVKIEYAILNDVDIYYVGMEPPSGGVTASSLLLPRNFTAVVNRNNNIALSWNESTNATNYKIYRSSSRTGNYTEIGSGKLALFVDNDNSLHENATYYYKISACNSSNECTDMIPDSDAVSIDFSLSNDPAYFVALSGSDSNNGSEDYPFATIGKAISTGKLSSAGFKVVVCPGEYNRNESVSGYSGSSENDRLTIISGTFSSCNPPTGRTQAKVYKFTVNMSSYVTIDNFEIESPDSTSQNIGVSISSSNHIDILRNYVHDTTSYGMNVSSSSDHIRLIGNTVDGVAQGGIGSSGTYILIENNNITDIVEHHNKRPRPEVTGDGDDADGLRIFGSNITIRGNRIANFADRSGEHGVLHGALSGLHPHADCLQTSYGGSQTVMHDVLFERNYCQSTHASSKGIMIDSLANNVSYNIVVKNNIFEVMDGAIFAYGGHHDNFHIYNNTIRCVLKMPYRDSWGSRGISIGSNAPNSWSKNNITVNCYKDFEFTQDNTFFLAYRTHALISPVNGTTYSTKNIENLDSIFENFIPNPANAFVTDNSINQTIGETQKVLWDSQYQASDLRLTANSPAINEGTYITPLPDPFDGVVRPQTDFAGNPRPSSGVDVGAYEY